MKRDEFEALAASSLYNEIADAEQARLDAWLREHPEDRAELEEARRVQGLLDQLGDVSAPAAPLRVMDEIRGPRRASVPWMRRGFALAACLALMFLAMSQGLVVQVGSFRLALGNAPELTDIEGEVRREMARNYLTVLNELTQTVKRVADETADLRARQATVEDSVLALSSYQETSQKYTQRQLTEFAAELVDEIDARMSRLYPIAYATTDPYGDSGGGGTRGNNQ